MRIAKKPMKKVVRASEDVMDPVEAPTSEDVEVAPEATELLFETEDVAQLLAEVTDEDVTVDVDDETDEIVFTVADEEYAVAPEGDEELLEACTKVRAGKSVKASRRVPGKVVSARRVSARRVARK